jgi:ADP-heptose:LPS heptosyltransferase
MPDDPTSLLVIRRRYLGDIVLLGSVLRNLRLHWPGARLTVLTEAAYTGVVALNPDADAALALPRSASGWPGFIAALRRARFTHVLDFDNTEKTALVARLTGAAVRATFDRELITFRYPRLYTHPAKVTNDFYDSHHITETYLALLPAVGVPVVSREVRLVPRPADLAAIAPLIGAGSASPRPTPSSSVPTPCPLPPAPSRLLVHPGSRSTFRIWPADRFAAVCDRLQDELGVQVFLTAGPGEQSLVAQIRGHAKSHLVVLDQPLTVGQFAALVSQFDLFLCHDSGPMHVAAAVGTPLVALFGSQNATIWRPLGAGSTVLQPSLPCPCLGAAESVPCTPGDSYRSYCVRRLPVEQVFAALAGMMSLKQETRKPGA